VEYADYTLFAETSAWLVITKGIAPLMGRDLIQMAENEWWIVETVSEYQSRQSKPFVSKEEAIETLRQGGCRQWILDELEDCGHVPSMLIGASGFWCMAGIEIGKALDKMDALCPDGEHSLFEDVACATEGCKNDTIDWDGDESICWECQEAKDAE